MSLLPTDLPPLAALWPAGAAAAAIGANSRRRDRCRRERLNAAMHELRRPLQILALARPVHRGQGLEPIELALHALRDLDREVNGSPAQTRSRAIDARELVDAAATRWRARAARSARPLRVRWLCGPAVLNGDPARLSQALDNLISNAVLHGRGAITLVASEVEGNIQIAVRDSGSALRPDRPRQGDPRHGHGLELAGRVAARHGGSLQLRRTRGGVVAALQLPVAARLTP
jgi:signal transduction histidine kinase